MFNSNLQLQAGPSLGNVATPRTHVLLMSCYGAKQPRPHSSRCEQLQRSSVLQRQHSCTSPQHQVSCQQLTQHADCPQLPGFGGSGGSGNGSNAKKHLSDNDDGRWRLRRGLSTVQWLLYLLVPASLVQLLHAPAASARSRAAAKYDEQLLSSWEIDAFVERMWELSGPILHNMGFSGLLGAAAAAALKMAGRMFAASLGICLILVQVLAYNNVITVNWSVVHEQARQVLDSTGDGRLDADGFKRRLKKGLVILSEGVPSVSGFLVGFLIGLKLF